MFFRGRRSRVRTVRRGAAAVELVLVLPVLLLLVVAAVDVARSIDASLTMQQAALAGARRAMLPGATNADVLASVTAAAGTLVPTTSIVRAADSIIVTVNYQMAAVTPFAGLVWSNRSIPVQKRSVALIP
jgi:Flp pilus assembly protein TadG